MKIDPSYMQMAMGLAIKAYGQTSPNPLVGAVVVKNGKIVGEGYHKRAGQSHAEVNALTRAGRKAEGSDLYITLEPCCHYGRTPPCTDLIIKRGIKRVIYGTLDPNPVVRGKGVAKLRKAGVEVVGPVLEDSCKRINRAYSKWITTGLPYVTAKIALTLDGRIADSHGNSRWISNDKSREYVHWLRAGSDIVMVGDKTFKLDKPRLNARIKGYSGKQPVPIIVKGGQGGMHLRKMMKELGSAGFQNILVEGGGELHSSLIRENLVDYFVIFIAPKLLGAPGKSWLSDIGVRSIDKTLNLKIEHSFMFESDIVIEGAPAR